MPSLPVTYLSLSPTPYNSLQQCTTVYNSVQQCTTVYNSVQQFTTVYNSVQECTIVYKSVTGVYMGVQGSSFKSLGCQEGHQRHPYPPSLELDPWRTSGS